jgi:hypothetical protein
MTMTMMMAARSPLRFLGPYPAMPLRFPDLATPSQRGRGASGVCLDWVLDTAANVNTINAAVARELDLERVGAAPGGVGAGGGMAGGDTFLLGDCELDVVVSTAGRPVDDDDDDDDDDGGGGGGGGGGEEEDDDDDGEGGGGRFVFMKGLTASALPVASPAAAGLLGLAFFYCFEGGVEFRWGSGKDSTGGGGVVSSSDDDDDDVDDGTPSVTFYGSDDRPDLDGLIRVPFESLPVSMLPSVTIRVNGREIPALFDTGSPITVLNRVAAEEAGIDTVVTLDDLDPSPGKSGGGGRWNPFSKLASSMQSAQEVAKATARGDVLTIAGTGGRPVRLVRAKSPVNVDVGGASSGGTTRCPLSPSARVYVGDLPGLAALGGLGGEAPPAAVLGMDLISTRSRVIFRARQNEIYL